MGNAWRESFVTTGETLLSRAGGTGKTTLSDKVVELIQENEPRSRIIRAALTHVAALLQKGQTIAHIMYKHLSETDAWFIFDEVSMIPSQLMGHIARWKMMGNKRLRIGDFKGQFLPIFDRWGDSKGIESSNLLHSLCNGLHINLTVYRRGRPCSLPVLPRPALLQRFCGRLETIRALGPTVHGLRGFCWLHGCAR